MDSRRERKFTYCRDWITQLQYYSALSQYKWHPMNYRNAQFIHSNIRKKHKKPGRSQRIKNRTSSKKQASRPSSPLLGTEEYRLRKIQQTSELIKRQLMNGDDANTNLPETNTTSENLDTSTSSQNTITKSNYCEVAAPYAETQTSKEKSGNKQSEELTSTLQKGSPRSTRKNDESYNIDEIYDKIVSHILNLNHGRKVKIINAASSGYDLAIQQIQKQQRLELSRALRAMCASESESTESAEVINSIIPDIGIKLEDLPKEIIQQLSITLNSGSDEPVFALTDDMIYEESSIISNINGCHDTGEILEQENKELSHETTWKSDETIILDNSFENNESVGDIQTLDKTCCNDIQINSDHKDNQSNRKEDEDCMIIEEAPVIIEIDDSPETPEKQRVTQNHRIKEPKLEDISDTALIEHISPDNCKQGNVFTSVADSSQVLHINGTTNACERISNSSFELPNLEIHNRYYETVNNTSSCISESSRTRNGNHVETCKSFSSISTQTQSTTYNENPKDLNEAISIMFEIDLEIERLSRIRKQLFINLNRQMESSGSRTASKDHEILLESRQENNHNNFSNVNTNTEKTPYLPSPNTYVNNLVQNRKPFALERKRLEFRNTNNSHSTNSHVDDIDNRILKKRKDDNVVSTVELNEIKTIKDVDFGMWNSWRASPCIRQQPSLLPKQDSKIQKAVSKEFVMADMNEKVVVMNTFGKRLVAGTETGKLFILSTSVGHLLATINATTSPITSFSVNKERQGQYLYVGSLDKQLVVYDFQSYKLKKTIKLENSVQCIENQWGYLFFGCSSGYLYRFSLKNSKVVYEECISSSSILVLVATMEGARRVLLVGTRNSPVCVRDAMSGLIMRTLDDVVSPTVYSIALKDGIVYCGTPSNDILAFSFHEGKLKEKMSVTNSKGVSCLKVEGNLLYASCYDGSIYVFNTKPRQFIGKVEGPGGVILSMEIVKNKIIVGTMTSKFTSVTIPNFILKMWKNK